MYRTKGKNSGCMFLGGHDSCFLWTWRISFETAPHHGPHVLRVKSPPSLQQVLLHTTAMALIKLASSALYHFFFFLLDWKSWWKSSSRLGWLELWRNSTSEMALEAIVNKHWLWEKAALSHCLQLQRDADSRRGHEQVRKVTWGKQEVLERFLPPSRVNETPVFRWFTWNGHY